MENQDKEEQIGKMEKKKVLSLRLAMLQVKNVEIIHDIYMFSIWNIKCVFFQFLCLSFEKLREMEINDKAGSEGGWKS